MERAWIKWAAGERGSAPQRPIVITIITIFAVRDKVRVVSPRTTGLPGRGGGDGADAGV